MRVKSHIKYFNYCSSEVASLRLWSDIDDDHKGQQQDVSDLEDAVICKSQKGESKFQKHIIVVMMMRIIEAADIVNEPFHNMVFSTRGKILYQSSCYVDIDRSCKDQAVSNPLLGHGLSPSIQKVQPYMITN